MRSQKIEHKINDRLHKLKNRPNGVIQLWPLIDITRYYYSLLWFEDLSVQCLCVLQFVQIGASNQNTCSWLSSANWTMTIAICCTRKFLRGKSNSRIKNYSPFLIYTALIQFKCCRSQNWYQSSSNKCSTGPLSALMYTEFLIIVRNRHEVLKRLGRFKAINKLEIKC